MRFLIILLAICLGASADVSEETKIAGGGPTSIGSYPYIASLHHRYFLLFWYHECGGTILTTRLIMTSARCLNDIQVGKWRARVGSSSSSRGGSVYNIESITIHPHYNNGTLKNDIAIMRTSLVMSFNSNVQAARLPPANYVIPSNGVVTAVGWGPLNYGGSVVRQLRHVQMTTVNQTDCAKRYETVGKVVTEDMVCAGNLGVGGTGPCGEDAGGPLYYSGMVVGVISYGTQCALPYYPSISTRVSSYVTWIQNLI